LLADVTYRFGVDRAAAALGADPSVVGRVRAARELAKNGGRTARDAIEAAFEREPFWGVLVETAWAIGESRAPWARALLIRALEHSHPKVARAAADALGNFRDEHAATALIELARRHSSYLVRAAALNALGKTRDPRAFDVLLAAVREKTWNGTVEAGAVHGLAELADARAMAVVREALNPESSEGLRRAAINAVARIGQLVESERTNAVEALEQHLNDESFSVSLNAIEAAETLGDARLLSGLDRSAETAVDGRLRRHAAEAAIRIRKESKTPAQVTMLREDVDELREQQRRLQEKIEAIART